MAIGIERSEHTAVELRRLACRAARPAQVRRMLAIALVMEGSDRTTAARSCGMDRQTLREGGRGRLRQAFKNVWPAPAS